MGQNFFGKMIYGALLMGVLFCSMCLLWFAMKTRKTAAGYELQTHFTNIQSDFHTLNSEIIRLKSTEDFNSITLNAEFLKLKDTTNRIQEILSEDLHLAAYAGPSLSLGDLTQELEKARQTALKLFEVPNDKLKLEFVDQLTTATKLSRTVMVLTTSEYKSRIGYAMYTADRLPRWLVQTAAALLMILFGLLFVGSKNNKWQREIAEQKQALAESAKYSGIGSVVGGIGYGLKKPVLDLQKASSSLKALFLEEIVDLNKCREFVAKINLATLDVQKVHDDLMQTIETSHKHDKKINSVRPIIESILSVMQGKLSSAGVRINLDDVEDGVEGYFDAQAFSQALGAIMVMGVEGLSNQQNRWIKIEASYENNYLKITVIDSRQSEVSDKLSKVRYEVNPYLYILRDLVKSQGGQLYLKRNAKSYQLSFSLPRNKESEDLGYRNAA